MRPLHVALITCVVAVSVGGAQVPTGYHLGAAVSLPDSSFIKWNGIDGTFSLRIVRAGATDRELTLIEKAERLYPNTNLLINSAATPDVRRRLESYSSGALKSDSKNPPRRPGPRADRWWLEHVDETWIPFAITGAAVDYYAARLADIAEGRGRFNGASFSPSEGKPHGSFEYTATVRPGSAQGVAYAVELELSWEYTCGGDCGVSFHSNRVVSFDAAGNIISVTGDGRPLVRVS